MDDDPVKAAETRRRNSRWTARAQAPFLVIGFHLPFPSIGFVETLQDGFEFRPAPLSVSTDLIRLKIRLQAI